MTRRVTGLGVALLLGVLPAADAGAATGARSYERALTQLESQELGPAHASEHAALRRAEQARAARWSKLTAAQRTRVRAAERRQSAVAARFARTTAGDPAKVGKWGKAFPVPNYAMHAAMLPSGSVIMWSYPRYAKRNDGYYPRDEGFAALWNPALGTGARAFRVLSPPKVTVDGITTRAPIDCVSESLLPNGDLFIAGGSLFPRGQFNQFRGLKLAFTFNPRTLKWTRQPDMMIGRWYPSQVELANGRIVIVGGLDETGKNTPGTPQPSYNNYVEAFTPPAASGGRGTMQVLGPAYRHTALYPHLFLLPNGNVALAGPGDQDSALLNITTAFDVNAPDGTAWKQLPPSTPHFGQERIGDTAVLRPQGPNGSYRVTQIGGYDYRDNNTGDAVSSTVTMDYSAASPRWRPDASLNVARSYGSTVLLPDSSMVTLGGGDGFRGYTPVKYPLQNWLTKTPKLKQVELFNPARNKWSLGPASTEYKAYHSVSVLLPDGRVFNAGDDFHEDQSPLTNNRWFGSAQVYSPPYLFRGKRPVIKAATTRARYGANILISSTSPSLRKAVLVAPGASTHGVDMNQRMVPLRTVKSTPGKGLAVAAPPNAAVAPPGPYMLFLLNSKGVPSVARWVTLTP